MTTRLGLLSKYGIEAAWLTAVVVMSLLFNAYSEQSFEPFKSIFLRVIVCLMLALWVGTFLTEAGSAAERRPQTTEQDGPAVVDHWPSALGLALVAMLALLYVSATLTSILPRVSFWGSHERVQGLLTVLAYLALFLTVWLHLKTDAQRQRLISSLILVSILVAGYGLLQRFGLDPIPWSTANVNPADRIISSIGNPIFVGGFLIMIVPITLSRLLSPPATYARAERGLWYGTYGLIALLQLMAVVFTQSRGPFLGLGVGLATFVLLVSFHIRLRKLAAVTLLVGAATALFIVVLNLPGTPLGPLAEVPLLSRLARLFDPRPFMGRVLVWKMAVDALNADPVRWLIGFGLDTMGAATTRFYPAELVALEAGRAADRAHNDLLQTVMSVGVPGLAVQLAFWGIVVLTGLQRLGIRIGRTRGWALPVVWVVSGGIGCLIPVLAFQTWQFSAPGLGIGLTVGLLVYLSVMALRGPNGGLPAAGGEPEVRGSTPTHGPSSNGTAESDSTDERDALLTIGLLSALVAHFMELQLGIGVTTTFSTFWVLSAVLLSNPVTEGTLAAPLQEADEARVSGQAARRRWGRRGWRSRTAPPLASEPSAALSVGLPGSRGAVFAGLITGLALVALAFGLVTNRPQPASVTLSVAGLLTGFIAFGGLIWSHDEGLWANAGQAVPRYLGLYLAVILLTSVVYFVGHQALVGPDRDVTLVVYWFALFLVAWLATVALWLAWPAFDRLPWLGARVWVYPVLVVMTGVVVNGVGLWWLRAEMYFKNCVVAQAAGRYEDSIRWCRQAIELAPDQDIYHAYVGLDGMLALSQATDLTASTQLFQQSEQEFQRAIALDPYNAEYPANLGRLYFNWAQRLPPGPGRTQILQTALAYYAQVEALSPNNYAPRIAEDVAAAREMLQGQ